MKILYFAWLRSKIGTGEEELTPPAGVVTVGQIMAWLTTLSPGHAEAFAKPTLIRAAVNQDFAGPDQPVGAEDELAFFLPVTGG